MDAFAHKLPAFVNQVCPIFAPAASERMTDSALLDQPAGIMTLADELEEAGE